MLLRFWYFLRFLLTTLLFLFGAVAGTAALTGSLISVTAEGVISRSAIGRQISDLFNGTTAPRALYDVEVYQIVFESIYPDGTVAPITAQVFIPLFGPPAAGQTTRLIDVLPLYAFAPGSTGLIDACRPSREHILGIHWGLYRSHVLSHAGQGVVGILPDYMGFGDPDRDQYYMVAQAEGRVMLDAARAVRNLLRSLSIVVDQLPVFAAGFSQGGHAVFAASDLHLEYAPDVDLRGVIGYGPTTNLFALFQEFPQAVPMLVYTFSQLYGEDRFDPQQILAPRFAADLEDSVLGQCVGGMQAYFPTSAQTLLQPSFYTALRSGRLAIEYPNVAAKLTANSTGLRSNRVPALILQGTEDTVVLVETQRHFVEQLLQLGRPVELVVYNGTRHDTRQISFRDVQSWMRERVADG